MKKIYTLANHKGLLYAKRISSVGCQIDLDFDDIHGQLKSAQTTPNHQYNVVGVLYLHVGEYPATAWIS